jgi:DNA-binding response OmpR family regulator
MSTPPHRDGRPRIVVIEHEQGVSDALSVAFRRRWPTADIMVAADEEAGVRMVAEQTPDAVVLDADLPLGSAADALDQVLLGSDVPVVRLGSHASDRYPSRSTTPDVDLELAKPFSTRVLVRFIDARLRKRRTPRVVERLVAAGSVLVVVALVLLAATQTATFNGVDRDLMCDLPVDGLTEQLDGFGWCD